MRGNARALTESGCFDSGDVKGALVQIFSVGRKRSWRRIDLCSEDSIQIAGAAWSLRRKDPRANWPL